MNNLKKEPMVKHSNQVHTTTDYFLFKSIEGNRNKNLLHINRLKKSMSENYLLTIIIVNEKYEIIDGQHRFDVIKELNLPLNYVVCKGYGLTEVHALNQNSKTWNADDYLDGYCRLKYPHYLKYSEFKERYGFGHVECMTILGGYSSNPGIDRTKIFYKGEFEIKDYDNACEIADKIKLSVNIIQATKEEVLCMRCLDCLKTMDENLNVSPHGSNTMLAVVPSRIKIKLLGGVIKHVLS